MIHPIEKERFCAICEQNAFPLPVEAGGIGIYNEKRLHRVCKQFSRVGEDHACFEVKIGPFVADVLEEGTVTEVQCGHFLPLREKILYYTGEGYDVTVVRPVLSDWTLLRADRETGEILRSRRYRVYERPIEILPLLYDLRELMAKELFCLRLLLIRGDEFRYSERMRYRREGAYDAELYPRELLDILEFRRREDYTYFLPQELPNTFGAAEFGTVTKLKGRKLYSALNVLIELGLLHRQKDGKKYWYVRN